MKKPTKKPTANRVRKNPHAVALGRLGGLKGGHARAKALGPERLSEISRAAVRARWERVRKAKGVL